MHIPAGDRQTRFGVRGIEVVNWVAIALAAVVLLTPKPLAAALEFNTRMVQMLAFALVGASAVAKVSAFKTMMPNGTPGENLLDKTLRQILLGVVLAMLLEICQNFVGRHTSFGGFLANATASVLGGALAYAAVQLTQRRQREIPSIAEAPTSRLSEFPAKQRARRLPVVALSANYWNSSWMNRQQLMSRLGGKGWPVIYSIGPLDVWNRGSSAWRDAPLFSRFETRNGVVLDRPGMFPFLWQKHPSYSNWVRQLHASRLARRVQTSHPGELICYLFRPEFRPYLDVLRPRYLVYHAYDAYSQLPGWSPLLQQYEAEIVAQADLVIATTEGTLGLIPKGGSARRHVLPNAADVKSVVAAVGRPCPADLSKIPHPRIGYSGAINQKLDFHLVRTIARARPDWHWVFIGETMVGSGSPEADLEISEAYNDCTNLPNVHFFGPRSMAEVPAYIVHMDVNTICYRTVPGWWEHGYPLKLHESLASGRPVVASPLKSILQFGDVVKLANGTDKWIAALEDALHDRSAEGAARRIAVAQENTWDKRVDQLEMWLTEMIERQ